jgi:hypothetical protein
VSTAFVELVLDNADRRLPVDRDEVRIRRVICFLWNVVVLSWLFAPETPAGVLRLPKKAPDNGK